MPDKIVFNSSMPRSGSTLLQNILAQNPRIYASATSGLIDVFLAARQVVTANPHFKAQDQRLMKAGFLGLVEGMLHGWYERLSDRPVCVDKSRGWINYYELLVQIDPKVKIVCCVRDLRAVLASMEKLWRKNKHLADQDEKLAQMNMATIPHRVAHWLNSAPVGSSVTSLVNAVQTGVFRHIHFVRFEDLTANPKATMKSLYAFLDEPEFEHDFDRVEQVTHEDDAHYPIYGDHVIREKVAPVPLDYIDVLGRDVCEQIKKSNALYFQKFYPSAT